MRSSGILAFAGAKNSGTWEKVVVQGAIKSSLGKRIEREKNPPLPLQKKGYCARLVEYLE